MLAGVGTIMKLWSLNDQSEDVFVWFHQLLDVGRFLMIDGSVVHLYIFYEILPVVFHLVKGGQ